jgi:hypothetical protein
MESMIEQTRRETNDPRTRDRKLAGTSERSHASLRLSHRPACQIDLPLGIDSSVAGVPWGESRGPIALPPQVPHESRHRGGPVASHDPAGQGLMGMGQFCDPV